MPAAFFDFDKTLLSVDSGQIIAWPMARRGLVRPMPALRFAWSGPLYLLGIKSRAAMQQVGFGAYEGQRLDEMVALMEALWAEVMAPALAPEPFERLRAHQAAGDRTVVLTASPEYVALPARAALGLDAVFGTWMEVRDGVLTGRTEGPILEGERKAERARAWAGEQGLDLADCAAYTDSVVDLPLLEAVGRPVAVAPDRALRGIAEARGWEIVSG